jgi:NAD(P)-dependent dehydrogenase (short-subunit alcohol dehydrogenase family)
MNQVGPTKSIQSSVLVTGATRGIGHEFVRQYAALGYRVFACYRANDGATSLGFLQREFPGRIVAYGLDVTSPYSVAALKTELCETSIDILINNAGVWGGEHQELGNIDYAAWMNAFEVNSIGPFRVIEALRSNVARSVQRKIVTLSSEMGSVGLGGAGAYAYRSSKAAANRIMQSIAKDLKAEGIFVLTIHPGWVKTDMGTAHAQITSKQSVAAMRMVIERLDAQSSGEFLTLDGLRLPW